MKLIQGECLDILKTLEDNSIDAIVTDPPYGLSFMGKKWDYDVPSIEVWQECLRVLKPGGYLLSFAGTRTQHRMAVRIEDAGFEIRDMIAWVYGSGFPKSLNIGKAVDKIAEKNTEVLQQKKELGKWLKEKRGEQPQKEISKHFPSKTGGLTGCVANWELGFNLPTWETWIKLKEILELDDRFDYLIKGRPKNWIEREREVVCKGESGFLEKNNVFEMDNKGYGSFDLTKGTSEWEGWGSSLKPALEPITVARKPLEGTIAQNCLKWGVGGINIDESRVDVADSEKEHFEKEWDREQSMSAELGGVAMNKGLKAVSLRDNVPTGRFPANLIHDGSDEVVELFPQTKSTASKGHFRKGNVVGYGRTPVAAGQFGDGAWIEGSKHNDSGSAARFFYCAKASKSERNMGCDGLEEKQRVFNGQSDKSSEDMKDVEERFTTQPQKNFHPTVKPIALMEYLIKLVSREGHTILDPFAGSFTTGIACINLDRKFIGIERDEEYLKIGRARIDYALNKKKSSLFSYDKTDKEVKQISGTDNLGDYYIDQNTGEKMYS